MGSIFDDAIFDGVSAEFRAKFREFHIRNPHILDLFRKYADEMRVRGFKRYSARTIFERIRWHIAIEKTGRVFKLNNNYPQFYARMTYLEDPEKWHGFFEFRTGKGRIPEALAD